MARHIRIRKYSAGFPACTLRAAPIELNLRFFFVRREFGALQSFYRTHSDAVTQAVRFLTPRSSSNRFESSKQSVNDKLCLSLRVVCTFLSPIHIHWADAKRFNMLISLGKEARAVKALFRKEKCFQNTFQNVYISPKASTHEPCTDGCENIMRLIRMCNSKADSLFTSSKLFSVIFIHRCSNLRFSFRMACL